MSHVSEQKDALVKAQHRNVNTSPDNKKTNQGLLDFINLAMKVDDGFIQRGRIHGA